MILAHQGGWDEIAMVAAPILLFGGMLWVARRRAITQAGEPEGSTDGAERRDPADPS